MVFGVRSTGDDPLRSNERSLRAVSELREAKADCFTKKKKSGRFRWYNNVACVKNSGMRAKAEEEEEEE